MPEQLLRLAAFRREHPEVDVHQGPFRMWYATLPLDGSEGYDGGSKNLAEHDLGLLLDELDELFARPD